MFANKNSRTKSMRRQAIDLVFVATLILAGSINTSDSAQAGVNQQQVDGDTTTFLYMPISLAGPTSNTINFGGTPFHSEFDGHDHAEEFDESALIESAYTALDTHLTEAADGTVRIDSDAVDALVAETGIKASIFEGIIAEMGAANTAIDEIEEDELSALGTNIGCIYGFPTLRNGSRGWWVWRLQTWLNQNHGQNLAADGVFGAKTEAAVRHVQTYWRNQGKTACWRAIGVDGIVGQQGWQIVRNTKSTNPAPPVDPGPSTNTYRQPQLGAATGLCAYGYRHKRYGKDSAMDRLENVGKSYKNRGEGYISVGNISLNGGGYMAPHSSHQVGLDIDLRPMRSDNGQCSSAMQWNWNGYDRDATRQLIKDLRATGRIKTILFNDPTLIKEGLSTYWKGHDNHLHVRFCEPGHSNSRYRC